MLSDEYVNSLIDPLTIEQEELGGYIVRDIIKHIRTLGTMPVSDIDKLRLLSETGKDVRKINELISKETGLTVKKVKKIIKAVAQSSYTDAKPFYDYRYKHFTPLSQNSEMLKIVKAVDASTSGVLRNLSDTRATGFIIKDKGLTTFKPLRDVYTASIDNAILAIESGENYETAVRRTIQQLLKSGYRKVYWDSGYTKRIDSAVRQAIHEGIKQLHLEMQREIAKQIGADGWQLSAHMYSAPDHEPFQGHQFTLDEFDKLQNNQDFSDTWGNHFKGVKRIIGQWNCRHWARAIIIGKSSFAYKPETLEKYKEKNNDGYTLPNGKKLTMYECTQYQRKIESQIRAEKLAQMAYESAGDRAKALECQARVTGLTAQYNAFSKACGLKPMKDRISIAGYKRLSLK